MNKKIFLLFAVIVLLMALLFYVRDNNVVQAPWNLNNIQKDQSSSAWKSFTWAGKYWIYKVLEDSCSIDKDCSLPNEFLEMSVCRFEAKCIENKCNVVCPSNSDTKTASWEIYRDDDNYQYDVSEVLDVTCKKKEDCELPFDYAVKSNCPYVMWCIDSKCNVLCPTFVE